jgi:hypothetical protein
MEIREIGLESVYADEMNPRRDFGDVEALAESFDHGIWPGEPVQPIVVVGDGARWRIVDGERRWRAMRKRGQATCHAVCCEGLDEANCVVAMLATDDKKELDGVERSRGVQQALLLGVEPEKVERVGRFKGAAQVRRAMDAVGDAEKAAQMPLAQLVAIDDARQAGDAEGAKAIASGGADWMREAERAAARRKTRETARLWRAKARELGFNVAGDRADIPEGYRYSRRADAENAGELDAGAVVLVTDYGAEVYVPAEERGGEVLSEEERARRERVETLHSQSAALQEGLWRWGVGRAYSDAGAFEDMVTALWLEKHNHYAGQTLDELADGAGAVVRGTVFSKAAATRRDECPRGRVRLAMFRDVLPRVERWQVVKLVDGETLSDYDRRQMLQLARLLRVADFCGFKTDFAGWSELCGALDELLRDDVAARTLGADDGADADEGTGGEGGVGGAEDEPEPIREID